MGKSTPMDHEAADRISWAALNDPGSATAQSGFDDRARGAAGKNEGDGGPVWDDDDDDD